MDVVIAGAGITGLAAAVSLRRSGHRVTVYERSSMNNELGAAINVPPNVARFLVPMGLNPVKARFVGSKGMRFDSYATMEPGAFHDHSHNTKVFGAPLYYSHRVDLHESLKRLATEPDGPGIPAKVQLKSEVSKYVSIRFARSRGSYNQSNSSKGPRWTIHNPRRRNGSDSGSGRCRRRHSLRRG
jgi:salicylate hydroxylase